MTEKEKEEKEQVKAEKTETKTAVAEEKTSSLEAESAAKPEADEETKPQLSEKMEGMVKIIEQMSVLELSELVKVLEDRFGVSAAPAVAAVAAAGAPGAGAGAEEEKSVFDVILTDIGPKKINVIKEVRALTSLGLKEAKDLVEAAPKEVKTELPKEEAEKMKKQLEAAGAKVELK